LYKIGLKLWSTNKNYVEEAKRLFNKGVYDYIELYAVPNSYTEYFELWEKTGIPFVVHAPHFREKMNLAKKENEELNLKLAKETLLFADSLNSEIVIFHPGIDGDINETIRQLRKIDDPRIVVENKPYYALDDGLICNGFSPGDISRIINEAKVGFCLDVGHSVCAANARKVNPMNYLDDFISLNPKMYHFTDGDYMGVYDKHAHLGEGTFNISELLDKVKDGSMITIETTKNSNENLNDFVLDVDYVRENKLSFELANSKDLMDVYILSNDTDVRKKSFNSNPISLEDHTKWFNSKIKDNNSVYYVIRNMKNNFVSQIRFDKIAGCNDWVVGISISPKYRGKKLSSMLLKSAISKLHINKNVTGVYAYVKEENIPSIRSFQKAGFMAVGKELVQGSESIKLRYVHEN